MDLMDRDDWAHIYDIARYNGIAPMELVVRLMAVNPYLTEKGIVRAAKEWSKERSVWDPKWDLIPT